MNPRWLERQTRLLLSWRERAREAAAGRHPGIDPAAALSEAQEANRLLEALRGEAHGHVEHLSQRLDRLNRAQQLIIESVQNGRLSPARANRRNRAIAGRIAALRDEIAVSRRYIAADTSDAAGGFVDLELAQYRPMARQPSYLRWNTMDPVDRRTVLLLGAALAVCLVAGLFYLRAGRAPEFGASLNGDPPETLAVWCHNHALRPVELLLAPHLDGAYGAASYHLEVAVRMPGEADFRTLGNLAPSNRDESGATNDPARINLDAGLYAVHHLRLASLLPSGPPPAALRVRVLRPGSGRAVLRTELPWPAP